MSKKVFHLKFCTPFFKNGGISRGFSKNFWDVVEFDWMEVKRKKGVSVMQKEAIEKAKECQPDLIFIQCQTDRNFRYETIQELMLVAPTVFFNFDARVPEETEWLYRLNEVCCHVFYSNGNDVAECAKRGIANCSVLQSSCDETEYYPLLKDPSLNIPSVVFISNKSSNFPLSQQRVNMVEALQKELGEDFGVYGMGWNGFVGVEREREIYSNSIFFISQNQFSYPEYNSDRYHRANSVGCYPISFKLWGSKGVIEFSKRVRLYLEWYKNMNESRKENWHSVNRKTFLSYDTYAHRIAQAEEVLKEKYGLIF